MDIVLAHAWFLDNDPHEKQVMKPYPPLGLLSVTAYLEQQNFEVTVFDSTFSTLSDYETLLKTHHPPVVGLYVTLMTKPTALKMIKLAKQYGAWVVLGGPEPPYYAEQYLNHGADIVVVGEGELTLTELLPVLKNKNRVALHGIDGIVFCEGDHLIHTPPRAQIPDLDVLPMPAYDAIALQDYVDAWRSHHGVGSLSVVTARGCPYTCTWCSHSVFGESHRRRDPILVADEVEHLIKTYHPDQLWYVDDVFTLNHRWLKTYAAELKRRDLYIPFECISRADRLNDEIIDLLATMGCSRLWIGSESGSQTVLDLMQRKTNVQAVQTMTHKLQAQGIETGMFIMMGYEGETHADLAATVDHLKIANPDIFLTTVAYPIKGTRYYAQVQDRIVEPAPWEHYTDRDLIVTGRHSKQYYQFATRWMVHAVQLKRHRHNGDYIAMVKSLIHIGIGRLGMMLTQHQTEKLPAGRGWYDADRTSPA